MLKEGIKQISSCIKPVPVIKLAENTGEILLIELKCLLLLLLVVCIVRTRFVWFAVN